MNAQKWIKAKNNNKKILHTFLAKFNVEFEESKNLLDGIYESFADFPNQTVSNNQF